MVWAGGEGVRHSERRSWQEDAASAEALKTSVRSPAAFGLVYRVHARLVLVHLTRRTFVPEAALDLTAETFAQAFASRRRFRGETDDVARWLLGIANHVLARSVGAAARSAARSVPGYRRACVRARRPGADRRARRP